MFERSRHQIHTDFSKGATIILGAIYAPQHESIRFPSSVLIVIIFVLDTEFVLFSAVI